MCLEMAVPGEFLMPPRHGGAALPFPHILNARPVIAAVLPHSQLSKLPKNFYFWF